MWEARQSTTPKIITLIDNNWNFYMCAKGEKYMIFEFEWIWRPANTKNNLENKVHDDQLKMTEFNWYLRKSVTSKNVCCNQILLP